MSKTRIEKRSAARRKVDARAERPGARPERAANASWDGRSRGNGGEGYSKGYGGSRGEGTGPSGAEEHNGKKR